MRRTPRNVRLLASVLAAASLAAGDGEAADEKIRCRTAYEHAQQLRRDGRMSASRTQLRVCVEACPATFSSDCRRWLDEVTALQPTVRLRARAGDGAPVRDVRVLVDGELLADPLPDEAIAVDPGTRVFRFESAGAQALEVKMTLEPGERDRVVDVRLPSPSAAAIAPVTVAPSSSTASAPSRLPSYVLGGVGAAGLLTAGVLVTAGHVERASLLDSCSPACDPRDVDAVRTLFWGSAISAGVGLAALGAGWLLWPARSGNTATARAPRLVPIGLGVGIAGLLP